MTKFRKYILSLSLLTALGLTVGCLKERPLGLVEIYDSNLEPTRKLSPLDTLWVKVSGLEPNKYYTVEVLDPNKNLITKMVTKTNEEGVIAASPLWYEVGLNKNGTLDISEDLSVKAFYIHVYDDDGNTDFEEPFWIVIKNQVDENSSPKPIVYACLENGTMENSFDETGTKILDDDGKLIPGKTKIYVYAENLNMKYIKDYDSNSGNATVDIYIVPFDGENAKEYDGKDIGSFGKIYKKVTINVTCNEINRLCKTLTPQLVWDLDNDPEKVINPKEGEGVFRLIVDIDKDNVFEIGKDVDGDGLIDIYHDGIDGASVAGFIIKNTSANDLQFEIKDQTNANVNYIGEHLDSTARGALYLYVYNLNVDPNTDIDICLSTDNQTCNITTSSTAIKDPNYYLPIINKAEIINTVDSTSSVYFGDNINNETKFYVYIDNNKDGAVDSNDKFIDIVKVLPEPSFSEVYTLDSNYKFTRIFNETNSMSGTKIYVKANKSAKIYVYKAGTITNGTKLDSNVALLTLDYNTPYTEKLLWDLNNKTQPKVINPNENNNAYDIVFDDGDGIYDNTNDKVITIFIKNTPVNDIPNLNYANIASGGMYKYKYDWERGKYIVDWDYRDYFDIWASDTKESYLWGATKGVKAVWNPLYSSWYRRHTENLGSVSGSPVYYGQYVDVYIVNADKYPLWSIRTKTIDGNVKNPEAVPLSDEIDIRGHKTIVPVQWSCGNGLGQQTIWHPPLKVGKYYIIVDVDRDGNITEGVDIIDAVNSQGKTIQTNSSIVGFSVVENLK